MILVIASTVPLYNLYNVYGVQSSLSASTTPSPQEVVCFSAIASSCPSIDRAVFRASREHVHSLCGHPGFGGV